MECLTLKNSLDHWAQRRRCILRLEASYTWSSPGVCPFLFNIIINDSEDETLIWFANDTNHEGAVGTLSSGDLPAEGVYAGTSRARTGQTREITPAHRATFFYLEIYAHAKIIPEFETNRFFYGPALLSLVEPVTTILAA